MIRGHATGSHKNDLYFMNRIKYFLKLSKNHTKKIMTKIGHNPLYKLCAPFSSYVKEREGERGSKRTNFLRIVTTYGEKHVWRGEWLSYFVSYLSVLLKISISILCSFFNNSKGHLMVEFWYVSHFILFFVPTVFLSE